MLLLMHIYCTYVANIVLTLLNILYMHLHCGLSNIKISLINLYKNKKNDKKND